MAPSASLRVCDDGVAEVTLHNPPVNALHPDLLMDAALKLAEAQHDPAVKAIVVTGAGKNFSAGFDISQFGKAQKKKQPGAAAPAPAIPKDGFADTNRMFVALLEAGDKPTVAAVRGPTLGGGLELAMACNARVCDPTATLGLPELQLGIIPGFGGTQRLPRLVGLEQGIKMILTSKSVKAKQAKAIGLASAVVPPDQLLATAHTHALEMARGERKREQALQKKDKLPPKPMVPYAFHMAKEQIQAKAPHLQHPVFCLDAMQAGIQHGGEAGLAAEAEAFAKSAALPQHKALVNVFFASKGTKKVRGVSDLGLKPNPVRAVAIIGGGLMGSGIATAALAAGQSVLIKEINQKFLDGAVARVAANFESKVRKGKLPQAKMDAMMARLSGTLEYGPEFAQVDMVVEAALENLELKQRIFADVERVTRPDCVLSTNTSTIDITLIGAKMQRPERIVGNHFFSPAHIMPLLEIVRAPNTPPQVTLDVLHWGAQIRKTPVVVGNCTGFAVNRVFFPYTMGALLLAEAGLDPYRIDRVVKGGFGMPMGPFQLCDLVGIDISMHVGANFVQDFADRVYVTRLIPGMFQAERLGQKNKRGFYNYGKGRGKGAPAPEVGPLLAAARESAGLGPRAAGFSDRDIWEFLFFPVLNEGCRVVAEGIVDKPRDLDIATVMSMGFPPYRGGLVHWGDHMGPAYVCERLEAWAGVFPECAGFFRPCAYLKGCADTGRKLSAGGAGAGGARAMAAASRL